MKPEQAAWLAGFVDGEGSVHASKQKTRREGIIYNYIRIELTNTNLEALRFVKLLVGAGAVNQIRRRGQVKNWKAAYRWTLTGKAAFELMGVIQPYVQVKRAQIDFILSKDGYRLTDLDVVVLQEMNQRGLRRREGEKKVA